MRRFAHLNNVAKAAIATTAMMVVADVSITLVSPSSSPAATAQPGPSRSAASAGPASRPPFRQTLTEKGVRFSIRVPRWWEPFSSMPTKKSPRGPISLNKSWVGAQGAEAIIYWTSFPDGDYADPCARELAPSIGRSAADLAAAVSTARGTKLVTGPVDVTLGGHPAKHVVLTVRKSIGCNPGFFYTWRDGGFGGAFWRTTDVGDTIRVWIVPVGGTRLFIAAATKEDANEPQVEQVVESIRFLSVVVRTSHPGG